MTSEPLSSETLGRCCYGGFKPKSACASCAAWPVGGELRTSKELLDDLREALKSGKGNYGHRLLCGKAAEEIERMSEWERMFGAWARRMIPGGEPLWPNVKWSQDVAMIAHALSSADSRSSETVSTPDAWMVLGEDGWRYLSGGEGDARQRMHSPTDKLYPLYRGELKVEICPWKGIPKDECRKCRESMEHAQKARVARKDCKTCLGYGMVGGFVSPDSGYQSDPCPDCSPENGEGSQT